ncbi:hypothetical protein [Kitasatospora sp. NPDC048538]|uniref:hypothetical protein n=1 Tax=unclassified Kitasatospora TaxID=2633591 RepID=UPI0033F9633C
MVTTVRLGGIRPQADVIGCGCLLAMLTAIVLSTTGAVSTGPCLLIAAGIVAAVAVGVPRTSLLRADEQGLALVLLAVPRRYAWQDVRGLAVDVGEEPETGAHRAVVRLRLADRPAGRGGRHRGPLLAVLALTEDDRTRGIERRELAELFALFGGRSLPVDRPDLANAVLAAHGLPALPA